MQKRHNLGFGAKAIKSLFFYFPALFFYALGICLALFLNYSISKIDSADEVNYDISPQCNNAILSHFQAFLRRHRRNLIIIIGMILVHVIEMWLEKQQLRG